MGFESAVGSKDEVAWVVVPFNNSYAPGPKTFDFDLVIPPLLNDFIGLQKDTVLVSFIGVVEIFRQSQIRPAGPSTSRHTSRPPSSSWR